MGKAIEIYMKAIQKGGKTVLELRDSEGNKGENDLDTKIRGNQKVKWFLDKDSNIEKILKIEAKDGDSKVFTKGPIAVDDDEWAARVKSTVSGKKAYNIEYLPVGGKPILLDPILDVIPPEDGQ